MFWQGFMKATERYWRLRAEDSFGAPICPLCEAVGTECEVCIIVQISGQPCLPQQLEEVTSQDLERLFQRIKGWLLFLNC